MNRAAARTATGPAPHAIDRRMEAVRQAARVLGFDVVAATSVEPLVRDGEALRAWCDAGFAGDMAYMARGARLASRPKDLAPASLSLLTLAVNYHASAPAFESEGRFGRVARYAWGLDYHKVVLPRLEALVLRIAEIEGRPVASRCFVDAVPLLERAAAVRAGLGFFGKNTNVLQPTSGSWFFLSEILLDVDLASEGRPVGVGCGTCQKCLVACPTSAFEGPYRLDARRCISYLTIENRGPIPGELRAACGPWLFGCDVCQDVCPFNRFATATAWPELRPEAGVGHRLDLVETLSLATDAEFAARFAGTALLRPRRRGLLRNAAVAAANVGCTAAVPALAERAAHDGEPLIRGHALWALARLDPRRASPLADRARGGDPDAFVRQEAIEILESPAA